MRFDFEPSCIASIEQSTSTAGTSSATVRWKVLESSAWPTAGSSPSRPLANPREIAELRRLQAGTSRSSASAVDLQIELLQLQRRVQSRVSLPSISLDAEYLNALLAARADPRVRAAADRLGRPAVPAARDGGRDAHARSARGRGLPARRDALPRRRRLPRRRALLVRGGQARQPRPIDPEVAGLEPRAAAGDAAVPDALGRRDHGADRSRRAGSSGTCPLCGGEPDFAVITPAAERLLICGRCSARWRFHQLTCPFCLNADRGRITSFATRDGLYRLYACDVCERYLKAFDARQRLAAGDAGRRCGRDAAARRGSDAAGLQVTAQAALQLAMTASGCG